MTCCGKGSNWTQILYRKKDTGESPKPLDGINTTTKIHVDKTLKGQFDTAKGATIPAH